MKIQSMFQKDIDRDINGVIKVSQDDQQSLKQELSEYIITKELRRHFATFFDNYAKAIDNPTDKIGVWISGFFGSGKSHFLKMLSYLLSNKEVDGKHAFDYFADKFDDPMMYATVQKCVRIPTESILFNIDIEGPINKDKTAVLRVFAKVFYNHCGFYGEDLKVAKLERFIEKQGKTEAFRAAFKEVNGDEWVNTRDSAAFFEDDVVEVLQSVLGMSETAACNWFNGEENADMSIKQLVSEIKEYVDSKEGNFRLLFCVDEVGQYIGDDGDLMMNLQSLVEEIGDKCRGKVWVMVTSQEAIDSVVKITGNDFSKIQGRFDTRLSLSSSSVDEVIKKRVLAKTEDADNLLQMEYEKEASGLKSLFAFDNPILDIKGFTSAAEFSATFFPSITKFGMAALLPGKSISVNDGMDVLVDGNPTRSTVERNAILNTAPKASVAIQYNDLMNMKKNERRELVAGKDIIYIYHNAIDAIGDKAPTESKVFDACETAIQELSGILRIIVNELSGTNIFITADHGFLYTYKPLSESDKIDRKTFSGNVYELGRRYALTAPDTTADFLLPINLEQELDGIPIKGYAPQDTIRMKVQGGGENYVHGGISLQELVVPVIAFKNLRTSNKHYVEVKNAELKLLSEGRKVSNLIFSLEFHQRQPVGDKIQPCTYSIYMTDDEGMVVSDRQTVIADKTSSNAAERVFRVRFNLKAGTYDKKKVYRLVIANDIDVEEIEFHIDIAFADDFGFDL